MKMIDLTDTIDPERRKNIPEFLKPLASALSPEFEYIHPTSSKAIEIFCNAFGCQPDDMPYGEAWGAEWLTDDVSSHCSTHVDAPLHSGSMCEGKPSRTISDVTLEELYCPGIVLDVSEWTRPGEEITVDMLEKALTATGSTIEDGHAVLIRTGQERFTPKDKEFFFQPGMTRASTLYLTEQGATVLGTDALGWDLPFPVMAERYKATGDCMVLWDGHKAIVEKEAFIVQQLTNLAALPLNGFHVGCFPLRYMNCSAAPARVVAFLDQ